MHIKSSGVLDCLGAVSQCLISTSWISPWSAATIGNNNQQLNPKHIPQDSSSPNTELLNRRGQNVPTWAVLLWLTVCIEHASVATQPRTWKHNSKTAGNHRLPNVWGLINWYAFISSTVIHHRPRGGLHPLDTVSLLYTEHQTVTHSKSYFVMIWLHWVFSHASGVALGMAVGVSVSQTLRHLVYPFGADWNISVSL